MTSIKKVPDGIFKSKLRRSGWGTLLLMVKRVVVPSEQFEERVASELVATIRHELEERAQFTLALSGGSTPATLYQRLAQPDYLHAVDWGRVHFFWGDERYVPATDPRNNYRMAYDTWLRYLPIDASHLHPMPTDCAEPADCAHRYEQYLRQVMGAEEPFPRFDLILLGMGEDGHTASLFPNDPALQERTRWVTVGHAPVEPKVRLTLTLPVLNAARRVWFLVRGESKREALQRVFHPQSGQSPPPAGLVRPSQGELIWWLDLPGI